MPTTEHAKKKSGLNINHKAPHAYHIPHTTQKREAMMMMQGRPPPLPPSASAPPPAAAAAQSPQQQHDNNNHNDARDEEEEAEEEAEEGAAGEAGGAEEAEEAEEEDDRPSRRFYLRYSGPMPDATLRRLLCARRLECFVVVEPQQQQPGADARTPGIIHARLRTHRRLRPSGLLMRIHTYNNNTQHSGGSNSGRIVLLRPERSRSGSNGIVVSGRARHAVAELRRCITTARLRRDPFYYRWSDAYASSSSAAEEDDDAHSHHHHHHHNGSSSSSSNDDEEEEGNNSGPMRAALVRSEARRRAAEAGAAALCAELGGLAQDVAIAARQHAAVRLQLRRAREAHAELSRACFGE
jgi:hypothetical protein